MDKNIEFLKKIATDKKYKFLLDEAEYLFKKSFRNDIKALKYSEFIIFSNTGSRHEYESSYFDRRGKLASAALMAMIYSDEKYICALSDIIWAICDEYTWVLPAHLNNENISPDKQHIDLFSAETGFALSEILFYLEDRLPKLIKERIKYEIDKRIIEPFINNTYFWEKIDNNWAAVCAGSVGAAFIYMCPDKLPLVEDRIAGAMECFLSSYEDDGVCREGYSYWNYGFGFFVYYAELLYRFTNGEKNYFSSQKIKTIAEFQQKTFIQGNIVASFADSSISSSYNIGLSHFLKSEYDIKLLEPEYRSSHINETGDTCYRFSAFLRNFLWVNPEYLDNFEKDNNFYWLKSSQWYINKNEKYSFAAKGGHNDEPHNHNDIGCFIIASNNIQLICDIGMGEYTKAYFDPETRYSLICNSSLGHSVPVINQKEQTVGKQFKGEIINADKNSLELSFAGAYDEPKLTGLKRSFVFNENEIILKDSFRLSDTDLSVTDRFVSKFKPQLSENSVIIENMEIIFDNELTEAVISSEVYKDHYAKDDTLYIIDFKIKSVFEITEVEFKLVIK